MGCFSILCTYCNSQCFIFYEWIAVVLTFSFLWVEYLISLALESRILCCSWYFMQFGLWLVFFMLFIGIFSSHVSINFSVASPTVLLISLNCQHAFSYIHWISLGSMVSFWHFINFLNGRTYLWKAMMLCGGCHSPCSFMLPVALYGWVCLWYNGLLFQGVGFIGNSSLFTPKVGCHLALLPCEHIKETIEGHLQWESVVAAIVYRTGDYDVKRTDLKWTWASNGRHCYSL